MKKIMYFAPAVLALLFYIWVGFAASFGGISPWVWFWVGIMFVSAIVMLKGKWYGCVGGLTVGLVVFYLGTQYSGQTIDIERPLGIILCIYYLLCGIVVRRKDSGRCYGLVADEKQERNLQNRFSFLLFSMYIS